MIRTIFLDFGNVVAFFDHNRAIQRLRAFTTTPPPTLDSVLYQSQLEADYECGRLTTAEYIAQARSSTGLRCSDAEFLDAYTDIFSPNPETMALIPHLADHYRLVLASNTNAAHADRFRKQFAEPLSAFDYLVVSYEAGYRKPERGFFDACQSQADANLNECLFVDDLMANVAAAQAFGWQVIHYAPGLDLLAALRSAGIRGLDDVSLANS